MCILVKLTMEVFSLLRLLAPKRPLAFISPMPNGKAWAQPTVAIGKERKEVALEAQAPSVLLPGQHGADNARKQPEEASGMGPQSP